MSNLTEQESILRKSGSRSHPASEDLSIKSVKDNLNRLIHDSLYKIESPIERAMELIGDKYSFQVLYLLQTEGKQRFVEIEKKITGISPRTLSARLKHLEKFNLINRYQYPTIPPKVEYELTERGAALSESMRCIEKWVDCWFPYSAS